MLKTLNKKQIIIAASVLGFVLLASLVVMSLKFTPVKRNLTIEAGSLVSITVEEFKDDTKFDVDFITDISTIDLNKAGDYTVVLRYKGRKYKTALHISDTTAPTATAVPYDVYKGDSPKADSFITDVYDSSPVAVDYLSKPDFNTLGEKTIYIKLIDSFGNEREIPVTINVINDTTAPEFEGLEEISVRVGQTVSYRKGVTVKDNHDTGLTFNFDSSAVNLEVAGEYKVTYTATDLSGNIGTAERTVKVLPKLLADEQTVKQLAKNVINQIITEDMNKHQMVKQIFNWVRSNINYVGSPETDFLNAAYVGFTKKRGDCYNYYSMTKMLLDECGIDNMFIERDGGKTTHYWHLVNVGTGWYHFDTTPQSLENPFRCFMKTDAQVWAYAKSRVDGRSDYYNFDLTKYPDRATENYKAN